MRIPASRRGGPAWLGILTGLVYGGLVLVALLWNSMLLGIMQRLHLNDLGKFYYDARAFLAGDPMYEPSPATLVPVTETASQQLLNLNPPHFHLAVLPVAWLDPPTVLVVWLVTGLLALGISLLAATRELGLRPSSPTVLVGGLVLISSAAFGSILTTGQLTFHLLPFVTWAWIAARRRRWTQVGVALGIAISIKSFMLILLPWLAVRGRVGAAVTSLAIAGAALGAGLGIFGIEAWRGWLSAVAAIDWYGFPLDASLRAFVVRVFDQTPNYETVLHAPGAVLPIWGIGFVLIGLTSLGLTITDHSPEATDRAFTLLLLAAVLMSPLGWVYYVLLALPSALGLLSARPAWPPGPDGGGILRRGRNLAAAGGAGVLLIPTVVVVATGTSGWHTLTLGSAHFWGVGWLWCAVVCDSVLARGAFAPRIEDAVRTLTPRSAL